MKLFRSKQIAEIDRFTITNEPIASIDLMERASRAICEWITEHTDLKRSFRVFVGPGNNGGDALAVSRLIAEIDCRVYVHIVKITEKLSPDAEINLKRLKDKKLAEINYIEREDQFPGFSEGEIILDGMFGSGLSRPLSGLAGSLVRYINESKKRSGLTVLAIDAPSGLFGEDNSTNNYSRIIQADHTLALQFPNISFFFPEHEIYTGKWHVIPIGLHPQAIEETGTEYFMADHEFIRTVVAGRKKFSHKGNFGHAMLIAGSYGKMGAAVLAAGSCLRTGAGLLTLHIPSCGYNIIQTALPEAMISIDSNEKTVIDVPDTTGYNAFGAGPGLGTGSETKTALNKLVNVLKEQKKPLVLDADALNILAADKKLLSQLPENTILTPHPKEFERLFGKYPDSYTRNRAQIGFSEKYKIIIVLKGAHTAITTPAGICWFNTTGNPGMATAGSGDVLTGIVLSLLAQGYKADIASIFAVYLHGLAGDLALENGSEESLIAGDITQNLGYAFRKIRKEE